MAELKRWADKMEFRGKVRTILLRAGWPLAKLVISNDRLEVFVCFRVACVKKEDVFRIEMVSGFRPSIKVWNNPEAYPHFQFWNRNAPQILQALELHGYTVKKEPNKTPQTTPGLRPSVSD